jgi:hypothetical protein
MTLWKCRLAVIDSKRTVSLFAGNSKWIKTIGGRHIEWLELSAQRHVCQFETELPPVERLQKVSRHWTGLTLLLDYDNEVSRIKGLAKAKAGQIEHCEIAY